MNAVCARKLEMKQILNKKLNKVQLFEIGITNETSLLKTVI